MGASAPGAEQNRWHRLGTLIHAHRDFLLVGVLFIAFRVFALLYFRPGGYIRDWSDYTTYLGIAQLSDQGLYPAVHYWLEYPPLFPWLFVGLYRLSLLIPPWLEDPRLWFNALLGMTLLAFEAGNLVLLYAIGRRSADRATALRAVVAYALLFTPFYVLTGYYDTLPLFFMLLGLYLTLEHGDWTGGLALGAGFAVKMTPIVLAPVAVRVLAGSRAKLRHVVGVVAAIALLSLPFWIQNHHLYLMSFRSSLGRSSWESLWAVLEGYFSFGVVGGDRFDPTVTDFSVYPATLPWLWITGAFIVFYLWVYTRRIDYRAPKKVLALAGATMAGFMLYSKGYSPQFLLYLLPFVVLLCPPWRAVMYAIALTTLNFMEHPVYFVLLPEQHWLLTWIVSWRALLFVALVVEELIVLLDSSAAFQRIWSRAATVGLLAGVIWLAFASVGLGRAYYDTRYRAEAYRPAIDYVIGQARTGQSRALAFTDDSVYARFYPFVHDALRLRVVKTARATWADELLAWTGPASFWLWRGDVTDPDLEAWLDKHVCLDLTQKFENGELFLLRPCKR